MILFAAACGCAALLRVAASRARRRGGRAPARPVPSFAARAVGAALVGPVLVLGAYIIAHGHITPGGGFSGGVIVAGALLLAYAAGQRRAAAAPAARSPCSRAPRRSAPRASWRWRSARWSPPARCCDNVLAARDVGDAALGAGRSRWATWRWASRWRARVASCSPSSSSRRCWRSPGERARLPRRGVAVRASASTASSPAATSCTS